MKKLNECHVLVSSSSFGQDDPSLKEQLEAAVGRVTYNTSGRPLSSERLQQLLPLVDGFIAGLDGIDAEALATADHLQVIARHGVGVGNVDLEAARRKGIVVTNTPKANAKSVAELTIALMLNLCRPIIDASAQLRRGGWPHTRGLTLEGRTVGLIGLGAVGKEVARRLAGFDCQILANDVALDEAFARDNGVAGRQLEDLLRQSDIVSLHVPVSKETAGMVNAGFLGKMKSGAFLVNTSQGDLVDEGALHWAILTGHIRGAALDAFIEEPPGDDNPLLALPQVIATPHMGAHTDGSTNVMGRMSLANCLAVLEGREPENRVI